MITCYYIFITLTQIYIKHNTTWIISIKMYNIFKRVMNTRPTVPIYFIFQAEYLFLDTFLYKYIYLLIQYDKQKIQAEKLKFYEFLQLSRYILNLFDFVYSAIKRDLRAFFHILYDFVHQRIVILNNCRRCAAFIIKKIPVYSLFRHVNRARHMGHIFISQEFLLLQINQVHELTFLFIR